MSEYTITFNTYSQELAEEICEHIASGGSLRRFCYGHTTKNGLKKPIAGRPSTVSVYRWLKDKPEFVVMYNAARLEQADSIADEIIDIADNDQLDPADRKLMIGARKWMAGKLRPKKYGDRVQIAGDEDSPLKVSKDLQDFTDDELRTIASVATVAIKKE